MTDYDGRPYPPLSPYMYYEDAGAAVDWLVAAFGLTERMRDVHPDGSIGHCEVEHDGGVVMIGAPPGFESPDRTGRAPFGIYVHVDDVEAHFAQAKAAGARIQEAPADRPYGVRSYGALDLEGNQWWFAQPLTP
jgi:uncharacterized glyoxalase superfamily protein PhnB